MLISRFYKKKLSFCHKLYFSNLYIFATRYRRPLIFQTMNSVKSNNLSLKYHQIVKIKGLDNFVTKTQFVIWQKLVNNLNLHCIDLNPDHCILKDNIYIDMQAGINFEVMRKTAISTISVVRMAFYPMDCC